MVMFYELVIRRLADDSVSLTTFGVRADLNGRNLLSKSQIASKGRIALTTFGVRADLMVGTYYKMPVACGNPGIIFLSFCKQVPNGYKK